MREILGIEEKKINNMLWENIKYFGAMFLVGVASGLAVVSMVGIYIRMAGPF